MVHQNMTLGFCFIILAILILKNVGPILLKTNTQSFISNTVFILCDIQWPRYIDRTTAVYLAIFWISSWSRQTNVTTTHWIIGCPRKTCFQVFHNENPFIYINTWLQVVVHQNYVSPISKLDQQSWFRWTITMNPIFNFWKSFWGPLTDLLPKSIKA